MRAVQGRALSPSPIALYLLGLAERGADGSVEVGGRTVLLHKGQVADVRAAEGDGDLAAFLRDSGRVAPEPLERCIAKAREEGAALEEVLARQRLLSAEAIKDVRRRLWLDRLVRGMARAAAEGREPSPVHAEPGRTPIASELGTASLVTLVLDALERRAADDDAGQVGARADHRLEWLPGPHLDRAQRWARFAGSEESPLVAALLKTEPAAAPRIAALVRAGLARIVSPEAAPAPPPRMPSIPVSPPSRNTPPLGSPTPARPSTLPRRRKPSVELDPGLTPIFHDEPQLTTDLPAFPEAVAKLDDPLDELEREIALLEQSSAPGRDRARAWRAFAEVWESRFGSIEETARAYREAAAADPEDRRSLERASELCAALGQADLAVAYARAAVSTASEGAERAAALWRYALVCRTLGKSSEALGALRAAAAADPKDPRPIELSVHLWRDIGRPRDAAKAAADAAERARAHDPSRALAWLALALGLEPKSAERAEAYAAELAKNGFSEAAIAVRADAALRTDDADARRSLLLAAAEQAEVAERPDVAAELLTRAFDAEPHVDILYEPLDADLMQAPLERALLLEEIAGAAPAESQAGWLVRAADARLEVPGDGTWETELRTRALTLEPEDAASLRAIREQATVQGDPRILADALERAIVRGRWAKLESQSAALEELARISETQLSAPVRAAWAWERAKAIAPGDPSPGRHLERLAPLLEEDKKRRRALEDAHASATGAARADAAMALADHLRDDPERRRRAAALYREVLEARPDDAHAVDAAARLFAIFGDEKSEADILGLRAEHSDKRAERVRLRLRRASLCALAGAWREAAQAAQKVLEELPSHREASHRLRRAASRLGDHDLLREALATESHVALPPQQRARVLTALAAELEMAESIDEAMSCAEAALTADPGSAEAALLVTRHLESVAEPRAALGIVRALFGDSPPILEAWARVARDAGERDAMLEALDAWAAVAPYDHEPWAMRLTAFPSAETPDPLAAAIEGALQPERVVAGLARPLATAIARLGELGDLERAASLAVRAADVLGPHGDALRELAGQLASNTPSYELRRAALERRIAPQIDEARVELLHELANLHREKGDRAAEARTHLRVLAVRPHEARSLDRLASIYAETGEVERLMAALALELEASTDARRFGPLMKLAAASARLRNDLDRAEGFLRDAWKPELEDDLPLLAAAGGLVTLGRARRAVEMLRDAGRKLAPRRAGPVYLRAVQIALKKVDDPRLALMTAVEGLERAPSSGPLLVAFEQIALELKDIDLAERTYRRVMDMAMGPHGRRAIAYRRARWLERARASSAALEAYLAAFERDPSAGAVYSSIERLARAAGDIEALVKAALLVAEKAGHPAVRMKMGREAARLLDQELRAPERAYDVLIQQWEHGDTDVEEDLVRLGTIVRGRDKARGDAAFERLIDGLRKRAEDAWMGDAKARILTRLGRVHAIGRRDVAAAQAVVDEGLAAARAEGAEPDLIAEIELEMASWLFAVGDTEAAQDRVRSALRAKPDHEGALKLAGTLPPSASLSPAAVTVPSPAPVEEEDAEPIPLVITTPPSAQMLPVKLGLVAQSTEVLSAAEVERLTIQPQIPPLPASPEVAKLLAEHDRELTEIEKQPSEVQALLADAERDLTEKEEAEVELLLAATGRSAPPPPSEGERTTDVEMIIEAKEETSTRRILSPNSEPSGLADVGVMTPTRVLVPPKRNSELPPSAIGRWTPSPLPALGDDPDALEERASALMATEPERAATKLRAAIVLEPHRIGALRALADAPPAASGAARSLARTLLSIIEPAKYAPELVPEPERPPRFWRDATYRPIRELWGMLWEHAQPAFRETPDLELLPNQLVTRVATTPESRAFTATLSALGIEDLPPFYFDRAHAGPLRVLRTPAPCIAAGPGFATGEPAMRFAIGRGLELADREHVLVATLPPERALIVVAALSAAFGPTDGKPVSKEAAQLASELWRVAPRTQAVLRELLANAPSWSDYGAIRREVVECGVRAGLVACGDLAAAVRALRTTPIGNDGELGAAIQGSAELSALIRFAFGAYAAS